MAADEDGVGGDDVANHDGRGALVEMQSSAGDRAAIERQRGQARFVSVVWSWWLCG